MKCGVAGRFLGFCAGPSFRIRRGLVGRRKNGEWLHIEFDCQQFARCLVVLAARDVSAVCEDTEVVVADGFVRPGWV